jgi:hypothetical protein
MLENPQFVLWFLRFVAFSFSPDPGISGFLLVILRANMDICFSRFRFLYSVWCLLFVHFLSGYTRDMVGFSGFGVLAISYASVSIVTFIIFPNA